MADESLYLSTYEAALAVVATAMKKARLLIDNLIINSFVAGMFFTVGGMFHLTIQAQFMSAYESNPGVVQLGCAAAYPIGLFYVVVMGTDLFNSNILFFSVGVARGAVSIIDLLISWLVSWWFNLVGTIFVCYIFSHYSGITQQESYVTASHLLLQEKGLYSFVQTLIKGMAGNFLVALAIYLQLMAKPLHVKFMLMFLPIFSFVGNGFTHSVADMYVITMGLINHGPVSVGEAAWKIFLPGAIGNMIGGSFFGLLIPWYLHIVVVEKDIRLLKLPRFILRDEQPELNQDSRVVRVKSGTGEDLKEDENDEEDETVQNSSGDGDNGASLNSADAEKEEQLDFYNPLDSATLPESNYRVPSISSMSIAPLAISRYSEGGRRYVNNKRSPKNVFPVYGMGAPLDRERTIASGIRRKLEGFEVGGGEEGAETMGTRLKRVVSRKPKSTTGDIESLRPRRASSAVSGLLINLRFLRRNSSRADIERRMEDAGIPPRAAQEANEVAGVAPFPYPSRSEIESRSQGDPRMEGKPKQENTKELQEERAGSLSSPALTTPSEDGTPSDSNSAFKVVLYQPER